MGTEITPGLADIASRCFGRRLLVREIRDDRRYAGEVPPRAIWSGTVAAENKENFMPALPTLVELFQSGVHFGHQVSKRHPKMQPYIFTVKNGIHIINLELTLQKLASALAFISRTVSQGGTVLLVGTKEQAKPIVQKYALETGMPYVNERWLGGTFTNFGEIARVISRFSELKRQRDSGELEKYTKKERLEFDREIERLRVIVGGVERMKKIPEAMFVIDVKHEHTAIAEAAKKRIPVVALCDTNVNPTPITHVIPGNDDAIKSIELITRIVAAAITEGQAEAGKQAAPSPEKPAAPAQKDAAVELAPSASENPELTTVT